MSSVGHVWLAPLDFDRFKARLPSVNPSNVIKGMSTEDDLGNAASGAIASDLAGIAGLDVAPDAAAAHVRALSKLCPRPPESQLMIIIHN